MTLIQQLRQRWQRFLDRYLDDWLRFWGIEPPEEERDG